MAYSQWQGTNPVYFNAGNVGIGTTTPGAKLSFINVDATSLSDGITWYNPSPLDYGIHRTAGTWVSPNYQQLRISFSTGIILNPGSSYGKSYVDIQGGGLRVSSGNVGIGTTTTGSFKLAVEGKIGAREVNVTTGVWADYVFEADYALPSLESLKVFIDKNKHLPEIPTAQEVETNGINLGEMNTLLLKKVEELTLYMITLKEENQELKKEVQKINARLNDK
jgi:hypothetical protein